MKHSHRIVSAANRATGSGRNAAKRDACYKLTLGTKRVEMASIAFREGDLIEAAKQTDQAIEQFKQFAADCRIAER